MRILLLGSTGLLGSALSRHLSQYPEITVTAPTHRELDVLDFNAVSRVLAHEYFDRVVYALGYTDVNKAQTERGACELLNVKALQHIIDHRVGVVHFSTDYVFDAPEGLEIPEDYPRSPLNVYGESKMEAEKRLEASGNPFWNIRTSWLFGHGGHNFIDTILEKSKFETYLRVVDDQIGRPTYAEDLAEAVVKHFLLAEPAVGHYHLQNSGAPASWADIADYVLDKTHWRGHTERVSSEAFASPAPRPHNSVLANTKLPHLRDWRHAVDAFLAERNK